MMMIKLALLKCMTVSSPLKGEYGDVSDMFLAFFSRQASRISLQIHAAEQGDLPEPDAPLDGIIISGSPCSPNENLEWIKKTRQFIQTSHRQKKKMLGICFGHQLLADALGGKVKRAPQGWGLGVQPVSIHQQMPWMEPAAKQCNIMVSYQDQVIELPPGAKRLASNSHCPNFMFALGHHVLGIQGHPEFSKSFAKALYQSRQEMLGQETLDHAMESLGHEVDPRLWLQWIHQFFVSH
jgi:GMP synthase-like glutamine amidotransferase